MKIDFKHTIYASALGLIHAVFSFGVFYTVFFFTPLFVLGFAVILLRNVNSFLEGLVYGLIYIIPGYIIHIFFLIVPQMWRHTFYDYHLWNYMNALSIGLILLSCVMGYTNSLKKSDITCDDVSIKINFMHCVYAVFITGLFLILLHVCSKLMWPIRGMMFFVFAPAILIGATYFAMRNIFGFVNGLIHGLIYAIVGGTVFYYVYFMNINSIANLQWFLFSGFFIITFSFTFSLLGGLIGWANAMRGISDSELLADISASSRFYREDDKPRSSVSEEIVTEEEDVKK